MKQISKSIFILIGLLITTSGFAWSYSGHVLVAQIAYDNLSISQQKKVDGLAMQIFAQLPPKEQAQLNAHYPTASTFAKDAMLPDMWRNWKLATLFKKYQAPLPTTLIPYQSQSTATWHYRDTPYPSNTSCQLTSKNQNVVQAIQLLSPLFKQSLQSVEQAQTMSLQAMYRNQAAILLILLTHYVGDIHQPLHTFGKLTQGCQTDEGGNNFCLNENAKGKCTQNLHALWDKGAGYLKPKMNIADSAHQLEMRYPRSSFSSEQIAVFSPEKWAKTNLGYAAFIYSAAPYQKPTPQYYQQGQVIANTQIVLAGYRLAYIIQSFLPG
ncbi:MAG: S1/P1 nuclease [Gammaproteobacteria bacterium]|nr:S1/P1 nuclease [Gammaproteobacteria bacterium]